MTRKNLIIYLVFLISGSAFLVGYDIYRNLEPSSWMKQKLETAQNRLSSNRDSITPATEQNVLQVPAENATDEEKQRHFDLAVSLARESQALEITNCKANPIVLKIENGKSFTVVNKDSVEHALVLTPELRFVIPAESPKTIAADFGKGPGLYGYGCDGIPRLMGLFLVTIPTEAIR